MMRVPLLDLKAQYAAIRDELHAAVERVMSSQQFILGPDVSKLEDEIAHYSQTGYAIGCASGSDALLLALMALGVHAGDEVITTPYSFFATASSITRLGVRPVFVDIEPRTYNIAPDKIEEAITPHTRAIMPVHLFGQCADMGAVTKIGERYGIPVVEDAAQSIGAEDCGRRAGSIGAIGCFSFYPSKNLGGAGDGGMLTTDDDALAERLQILRVHGSKISYYHSMIGINSRLDSIQAAVLRVKLRYLDSWLDARWKNAQRYNRLFENAGLTDRVILPSARSGGRHTFNQYIIRVGQHRDALAQHLKENNIGTNIYHPVPLHMQECFRYLGYKEGDFPGAEAAARETLALPIYPELSIEQQQHVVAAIHSFGPWAAS